MGILIALLTFILVVNCLFLILLVLVQLPKKEAGAGMAFGAGAGDALFGAGSGNVLTKVTKYAAGIFLGLSVLLSVMNINHHKSTGSSDELRRELEKKAKIPAAMPAASTPVQTPAATPASTNLGVPGDIKIELPKAADAPAAPQKK